MTFEILVLRFMSFILRAQYLGGVSKEEARVLLNSIDRRVAVNEHRTLPAGIETKHGQAAIDVEED